MTNITGYAETNLKTFEESPPNAVDSLILSWLSILRYPEEAKGIRTWRGTRFYELYRAEWFPALFDPIWMGSESKELFAAMAASPRFRDIRLCGYTERNDPEAEKQFAALCYRISDTQTYLAFRGTDTSLIGWKEDFNMAFRYPIPSQASALKYLLSAARHIRGDILIGGHSKGGNLAVYAAANSPSSVKDRITRIYSHDGPGFLAETLESAAFRSVASRLDKTVPQSSVIGLLLEQQETYRIVRSRRTGLMQHDPFSWCVEGTDFVPCRALTADARFLDRTLNEWIRSLSVEEREQFVDALFTILSAGDMTDLNELAANWKSAVPAIARSVSELAPTTQRFLKDTIQSLISLGMKHFPELLGARASSSRGSRRRSRRSPDPPLYK